MQDRYTGDIGDYVKFGLLRSLLPGRRLGVAWYLVPDEQHNDDGRHVSYLDKPEQWRSHDPELFDSLRSIVKENRRSVAAIEQSGLLPGAVFASERLGAQGFGRGERRKWREAWFSRVRGALAGCDLVFADPDNGFCPDEEFNPARRRYDKRMPLREAHDLAEGRTAVVYHHNTRHRGGHSEEVRCWLGELPAGAAAIYWRAQSPRTFFVLNPSDDTSERLAAFARLWEPRARLIVSDVKDVGAQA